MCVFGSLLTRVIYFILLHTFASSAPHLRGSASCSYFSSTIFLFTPSRIVSSIGFFFTSARSLILPVPPRHSFPLFLGDPGRALPYFSPPFPLLWSPSPLLSLSFPSLPLFPSLILAARRSIPRRARWGKVSNREKGKTGKEGTGRGR